MNKNQLRFHNALTPACEEIKEMEEYVNKGIKEIIDEFPEVEDILNDYDIGCGYLKTRSGSSWPGSPRPSILNRISASPGQRKKPRPSLKD
jgi:hypothetical protein